MSLAIGITKFVSTFFSRLPYQEPKDPADWIILDVWALLSFISVEILLENAFISVFVLLLEIIHVAILHLESFSYLFLILFLSYFFAADFNLFNCVFVSLTLDNFHLL